MIQIYRVFIIRCTCIIFCVLSIFLSLNILSFYLPYNLFKVKDTNNNKTILVKNFLPQGWSFFTKNPREKIFKIYKYNKLTKNYSYSGFKGTSVRSWFGLKKDFRVSQLEIANLAGHVKEWEFSNNLDSLIKFGSHKNKISLKTPLESKLYCGDYLIVEKSVIPYVYRNHISRSAIKSKYAHLIINCE